MRGGAGRSRFGLAAVALATAAATLAPLGLVSRAFADDAAARTIAGLQAAVLEMHHQPELSADQAALARASDALRRDTAVFSGRRADAAFTAARLGQTASELAAARSGLTDAQNNLVARRSVLGDDRRRLRAVAVALYTGQAAAPQFSSLRELEADQTAILSAGEFEAVAAVVVRNLHADVAAEQAADQAAARAARVAGQATDAFNRASDDNAAAAAASALAASAVAADQTKAAAATAALQAARQSLATDLAALTAAAGGGGLTILGQSVLSAAELAGWYRAEGYADLTATPIEQLASWYTQAGAALGVRGDVAFAQAVLETAGFVSPDSVDLSNFAGIGHCDSCNAGWAFPSPQGGVVGQEQLLRIFAARGAPPPGAPAPVLPSLTTSGQYETGCCPTWESLAGVWATDPGYGTSILGIYQQMLSWALSSKV